MGVLVVMLAAAGCTFLTQQAQRSKESQSAQANPSSTTTTTTTTEPTSASTRTTTQPVATRLDITGAGSKTTEKFTVGPEWTVEWSYDCSPQAASVGVFQVWPKGNDEADLLLPIMTSPETPKATGTQNYHEAGEFYLDILSICDWTIVVRG